MGKCKNISKKLEAAKLMPPKYHTLPGESYSTKNSEVINWLIKNPQILEFVWDHVRQSGYVKYDKESGMWQGVDYHDD